MPIAGAILADAVLGKYRTILFLSVIYCFGLLALVLDQTRFGLFFGFLLVSIGAGEIKPCVSAHVGDQFGRGNQRLLPRAFAWFWCSVNLGATFAFWLGRRKFVHVPPAGLGFVRECFSRQGRSAVARLLIIYVFVAIFWSLDDQGSGGEWTIQARSRDLNLFGLHLLPEQVFGISPILVLLLVPALNIWTYPWVHRHWTLTPLRKIQVGFFLLPLSFVVVWVAQLQIEQGGRPSVVWQIFAYVLLAASEVIALLTGLEFTYTQAPTRMKSIMMAVWIFTAAVGNQFTALINFFVPLHGSAFFLFFSLLMFLAAAIFLPVSRLYRGTTYIQGDEDADAVVAET